MEKRKARVAGTKKAVKKVAKKYIFVDYPRESEDFLQGEYAIRVSAPCEFIPEISINGSGWSKCRPGAGYWWFDWVDYPKGTHKIDARICNKGGKPVKSVSRVCICKG